MTSQHPDETRSGRPRSGAAGPYGPLVALVCPWSSAEAVSAAAAAVEDWPALLSQARAEAVAGLLAAAVAARPELPVPEEARDQLEIMRRAAAHRALTHALVLVRVLERLAATGVPALALKGPALSQTLYGDVGLRTFADLDVLVRPCDFLAARGTLLAAGFAYANQEVELVMRRGGGRIGEVLLAGPGGQPFVDLHWRVALGLSGREIPVGPLFAGSRDVELLGCRVRVPGERHQLLLAAMHGARHNAQTLEARISVAALARRVPPAAWPAVLREAHRVGSHRAFVAVVAASCASVAVPVPSEVGGALARDRVATAYARHLWRSAGRRSLTESDDPVLRLAGTSWRVALEDSPLAALSHLGEWALRPGPRDWLALDLPPYLGWAYWLVRPARLCHKYLRAF